MLHKNAAHYKQQRHLEQRAAILKAAALEIYQNESINLTVAALLTVSYSRWL